MRVLQMMAAVSLSVAVGAAVAQTAGDAARGSTPPGMSQDGSRPHEGAITGGKPIVPGETAGTPDRDVSTGKNEERLRRCDELSGSLREECLRKEGSGAAGGTSGGTAPRDSEPVDVPGKGDLTTK